MTTVVVDTNVAVVANGSADHADLDCELACTRRLQKIMSVGRITLDDGYHILSEYRRYLTPLGEPSIGGKFLKWAFISQSNPERCQSVSITPTSDNRAFLEFPDDPGLSSFDPSDRKFVAAALAGPFVAPILVAIERGYRNHMDSLRRNGVDVEFLC